MQPETGRTTCRGIVCGVVAYLIWGFFPLFFKQLQHLPPLEVVSHRIVWSLLFLTVIIMVRGERSVIARVLCDRKSMLYLLATALLISTNWLVFIYAVGRGDILQSSLGYFMTPLVNIMLGVIVLREKMRPWQLVSLVLAVAGVGVQVAGIGRLPIVALVLAATFGLYGLLRKIAPVEALSGLTVETAVLFLPAAGFLISAGNQSGNLLPGRLPQDLVLLPLAGVLTAVPLILFAAAARKLRMTTIGFLQYITPSMHFMQAVFIYRETFSATHLASFCCIWAGLVIYTIDSRLTTR